MNILIRSVILILILALLLPSSIVMAVPTFHLFWGTVTLDGSPAPDGTPVTATMSGYPDFGTITSGGSYGLTINGESVADTGKNIDFSVDGIYSASSTFATQGNTNLDLSAFSPPPEYTLTINTGGSGSGSTSGAGAYTEDTTANISATPNHGSEFVGWTGDAVTNPSASSTTILMDADKTITANFNLLPEYSLTLTTEGNGSANASPGPPYYKGDSVQINATANEGYKFAFWSGDIIYVNNINNQTASVTMNGDYTITANFVEAEVFTLTMNVNGSGSTTPPVGEHQYEEGEVVPITATHDEGWEFVNWTGGVTNPDSASTTVTMNADKTITANFRQIGVTTYNLTIEVNGSGSTTPAAGNYPYPEGTVVNLSATPDEGWLFDGWTGDVANPDSASTSVTIDGDKTISASFSQLPVFTLTIEVNGSGSTTPAAGNYPYPEGSRVDINATPDEGWLFDGWTGDVANPNSASTTVTIDSDKTISASFLEEEALVYTLTINVSGSGSTSPAAGKHQYEEGEVVSINATPGEGWQFDGWTGDVTNPNSASTTVTIDSDKTISASFSDATPPAVSDVSAVGASRTAVDIIWITDEPGDSQVDYWASPGQLTPLDSTLVTGHRVRLTELIPATTYHYMVMSKDANGNLTVSKEYSFTTAAIEATFSTINWNTSLDNVEDGTQLTVSFTVANNGDIAGPYTAQLNVNGNVVDTENVNLEAGASQDITLTSTQSAVDTYTVSLDGFTLSFEVAAAGGGGIGLLPVIGIIAGLLMLFAAIIIFLKRDQLKERFVDRESFPDTKDRLPIFKEGQYVKETAATTQQGTLPPFEEEAVIGKEKETEEEVEEKSYGLTITALAMLKLREALQSKTLDPEVGFRIIPSPSKPSQLKMILDRFKKDDKVVESEGVKILFISPDLVPMLEEMLIDYQETPQGGGFTILKSTAD